MSLQFTIPDGKSRAQLEAVLFERRVRPEEEQPTHSWRILDTFDWLLASKSLLLKWTGRELILCAVPDEKVIHSLPLTDRPIFAANIPPGPFQDELGRVIDRRALLEIAAVDTQSWTYRVLDDQEKIIARLTYCEARLRTPGNEMLQANQLSVKPLRGYTKQTTRFIEQLRAELPVKRLGDGDPHWALQAVAEVSPPYTAKLKFKLSPDMPAAEATRMILRRLLEMIRANEAGIKDDIDIEFLHDYRIAVRRTRSALRQMRRVFPTDKYDTFRNQLKTLGQLTNNLRDLDVYLTAEAGYRALLPNNLQDDMTPLFDYLRSQRAGALAEVFAGLESDDYSRLMAEWDEFLHETASDDDPPQATEPIIRPARKRIARQYGDIVRDGTRILESGEYDLLHTLRIEGKELRYLMEFFAGLFPAAEIAPLIKRLKRLQDNLGAYTDLDIQQAYLLHIAEALDIDKVRARRALMATGFLVETMAREQRGVRVEFAEAFRDFTSPKQQKGFQKLFGRTKGEKG